MGRIPVRGAAAAELGLALPPERMPLLRGGRPSRSRWDAPRAEPLQEELRRVQRRAPLRRRPGSGRDRHTTWRWSAGVGRARSGQRVAWNLVEGIHDAAEASERTVWIDGEPQEVGPQPFAADLSRVGGLCFTPWSVREERKNLLLVRSPYRQPFGTFAGELPGGLPLESGQGVMEWHDVLW
jgi:Protein of unknown function (DUF2804)